jgi:3-vinyl bacteriochlorophyllide hydratase
MACKSTSSKPMSHPSESHPLPGMLYTPEQRVLRDHTIWTPIQGFLAIFQFFVFMVSLWLVVRCLLSGEGAEWAKWSIILKTLTLYTIMVTGSIWEKVVFGQYLFAPAFFWEDVVSMVVIVLHSIYIASLFYPLLTLQEQMLLILCAYVTYVVNAAQFVLKLRAARLQEAKSKAMHRLDTDPQVAALQASQGYAS